MPLPIQSNLPAQKVGNDLSKLSKRIRGHYERLSSGRRINSAKDDPAGLAISTRLRAQLAGYGQATQSASNGLSLASVADAGVGQVSELVGKLKQLSVQSKNGTLSEQDKQSLQNEADQVLEQIDQIAGSTDFNGISLLDGSVTSVEFDVSGGNGGGGVSLSLGGANAKSLGLDGFDLDGAGASGALDAALSQLGGLSAKLGATSNRLESSSNVLGEQISALTDAESRIADADIAKEQAELIRDRIRQEAALSIGAQANIQPKNALSLLK